MNNDFLDQERCSHCGNKVSDIIANKAKCEIFDNLRAKVMSQLGPSHHLWMAAVSLFNFRFLDTIVYISWTLESLFKVGDYNPKTGRYRKSLVKD